MNSVSKVVSKGLTGLKTRPIGRRVGSVGVGLEVSVRHLSAVTAQIISEFVPKHQKATNDEIQVLQQFVRSKDKLLVLTGAGISTESGIPDYRSEGVGLYDRKGHKPIQYQDFVKSDSIRRRYWARNYFGNH